MTRMVVKRIKNGHRTDPTFAEHSLDGYQPLHLSNCSGSSWALRDPLHMLSDCPLERLDLVLTSNPSPTPSSAGGASQREESLPDASLY